MEAIIALFVAAAAFVVLRNSKAAPQPQQGDNAAIVPDTTASDGTTQSAGIDYTAPIQEVGPDQPAATGGSGVLDELLDIIRQHEGLRLQTYDDVGHPAIGYGHDLLPGESFPNGITQDQAEALLQQDVAKARAVVTSSVTVPISDAQSNALTDLVYNIGIGNFKNSTLLKLLNEGDYAGALAQFARWIHAGGKVNQSLIARRAQEQSMWNG